MSQTLPVTYRYSDEKAPEYWCTLLRYGWCTMQRNIHGIPLCISHQKWVKEKEAVSTFAAMSLYFALKERGVYAQLEQFDGFKHIDIAIPEAKVNIEVDRGHHNYNDQQTLADLKRTYHSFKKGYLTLRIPNSIVMVHLETTANYLVEMLNLNRTRILNVKSSFKRF